MIVKPLEDRVLVKPLESGEEVKKGGIIIPDTAKEKPEEGKVVAVGPGKVLENGQKKHIEVKKGDKVLFAKYAGNEVTIDGEKHLILREDDILAVIE
ncbi:MAG: co-chaperone GroES [Candidatus Firestonebacteria bacterium]